MNITLIHRLRGPHVASYSVTPRVFLLLEGVASLSTLCVLEYDDGNECFIAGTFHCVVKFIVCYGQLYLQSSDFCFS